MEPSPPSPKSQTRRRILADLSQSVEGERMKKTEEATKVALGTVVVVLLAIACLMLIVVLGKALLNPEPHFTITEEECVYESTGKIQSACSLGCDWYSIHSNNSDFIKQCYSSCGFERKEVCGPVEVEEIVYISQFEKGECEEVILKFGDEVRGRTVYRNDTAICTIDFWVTEIIFQRDLKIDWLSNNAEYCIADEQKCKIYDSMLDCEWAGLQGCCVTKNYECTKWILGDYTIEVVK